MKEEYIDGGKGRGRYRGERSHYGRGKGSRQRGAKTFRRGRAIAFLETLQVKRSTLKQQLELSEFQSIHPILVGELKAIDMIINEFVQVFELHEEEAYAQETIEEMKGSKENEDN